MMMYDDDDDDRNAKNILQGGIQKFQDKEGRSNDRVPIYMVTQLCVGNFNGTQLNFYVKWLVFKTASLSTTIMIPVDV